MNDEGFLQKKELKMRALKAQKALRAWYLSNCRPLPWRETPSLYGTWLSEVMLQQTRVETGIPKWHAFLKAFPTVQDLALASDDEVMKAWEGLGYYRRAKLLHKAAQRIHEAGAFPSNHDEWLTLPGIGPYTAAAISSIGMEEPVVAVDGNVQRVAARWEGISLAVDTSAGDKAVREVAEAWLDRSHPGDHNQAVMELGALVCTPKNAQCCSCPIASTCKSAGNEKIWSTLPAKKPKKPPQAWTLRWQIVTWNSEVVVTQNPGHGIWSGLYVFPELRPGISFAEIGSMFDPVTHVLTHKRIDAHFILWQAPNRGALKEYSKLVNGEVLNWSAFGERPRPRLLTKMWDELLRSTGNEELH